jgi:hypothetical protein
MKNRVQQLMLIVATLAVSVAATTQKGVSADQRALQTLEQRWLASEHDRATLQQILADDFLHPVPAGVFLTKTEHIDWTVNHPAPAGRRQRFDQMRVRIYDNVGIVTGIVVATGINGRDERTVFTDVFVRRNGTWQAVNAQENAVPSATAASGRWP